MATAIPRFVAICGHPKSGKSEVQRMLKEEFNYLPVDDGAVMRQFAMTHLGLTKDQVYTQEGKAEFVEILGKRWQVRQILGEFGNHLEAMFGPDIFAHLAVKSVEKIYPPSQGFSFGSVRREQGAYYQRLGGVVIGVANPQAGPSPYEFDRFNESIVDAWINNDALARGLSKEDGLRDLRGKVTAVMASRSIARAA